MLSIADFLGSRNRRHRCWFYELSFHVNPIISLHAFVFMHICTYYHYLCDWCFWAGTNGVKTLIIYAQRARWLTTSMGAGNKDIRTVRWLRVAPETMVNFLTRRDVKYSGCFIRDAQSPQKMIHNIYENRWPVNPSELRFTSAAAVA